MNITIIILLSFLLIAIIILGVMIINKLNSVNSNIPPTKIDIDLTNLNKFIKREFLFEFIKWIMPSIKTLDAEGPIKSPSFINELKNPDILQEKMSLIAINIISKMSIYLINEFNAVYNKNFDNNAKERNTNANLYNYITRQIMFFIRRVDFEITTLLETDIESKPSDILKQYVLAIEAEIYKLNNILIVEEPNETEKSE